MDTTLDTTIGIALYIVPLDVVSRARVVRVLVVILVASDKVECGTRGTGETIERRDRWRVETRWMVLVRG
jgi:hypothetical protein